MRVGRAVGIVALVSALHAPLFAKCAISDNGTLVVRAPVGNLIVDTSGRGGVDVSVTNKEIQVRENCQGERVELTATAPRMLNGAADWKISVAKTVNLDLVTDGGSIQVGDSDANVTLRTTGGSVTVGNIRGRAAIVTQGGPIRTGNVGQGAEMRSLGGAIVAGDIAGNADLRTAVGPIETGSITGSVNAETGGGNITIRDCKGSVKAETAAGNISLGLAGQTTARTAGGNIITRKILGFFKGHTDNGDIRLDSVSGWVEATTNSGNIICRLEPQKLRDDLHVDLQTGMGDITLQIPEKLSAHVEAVVERISLSAQRIFADFPNSAPLAGRASFFGREPNGPARYETVLNQGANRIRLRTTNGKIEIRKR